MFISHSSHVLVVQYVHKLILMKMQHIVGPGRKSPLAVGTKVRGSEVTAAPSVVTGDKCYS